MRLNKVTDLTSFNINDIVMATMSKGSIVVKEEFDIFVKSSDGYTRFVEEGPETFKGDNSDGKGMVKNIVPVTEFYTVEQIKESKYNDGTPFLIVTDIEPLNDYNKKYNMG